MKARFAILSLVVLLCSAMFAPSALAMPAKTSAPHGSASPDIGAGCQPTNSSVQITYVTPNPADTGQNVHAHVHWNCEEGVTESLVVYLSWGDGDTQNYTCHLRCGVGDTDFYHDVTTPYGKNSTYHMVAYEYLYNGNRVNSPTVNLTVYWVCCIVQRV